MEEKISNKCGVYLITSPSNGRYVGSSKHLDKRFNRYRNYSCSRQSAIYSSLKKYGYENHKIKILMHCEEGERLFWERIFGDLYLSSAEYKNGLNLLLPGYDDIPPVVTQEFRDKISKTQIERFKDPAQRENTSIKTKHGFTSEVKEKMSELHKKRFEDPTLRAQRSQVRTQYYKDNPEAKEKVAQKQREVMAKDPLLKKKCLAGFKKYRGENPTAHSELMKKKHRDNPELGKTHSERLKQRYIDNPEWREQAAIKTRIQIQQNGHNMSKKVINIETKEEFNTVKDAAKSTIYGVSTFREILKGRHKIKLPYQYV